MNAKKLYVRETQYGVSVGEYVRGKWHNVVAIKDKADEFRIGELAVMILRFKRDIGRNVEFVGYHGFVVPSYLLELVK